MKNTKLQDKKNVLEFVYNFSTVVQKNNWVSRYDTESDSLSLTVNKLPNDARIKYFGNEFGFYLNKNSEVKGIFIEYFKNNLVQHNRKKKNILQFEKTMEGKTKNKNNVMIELSKNQINNSVIKEFEELLKESLAKNLNLDPT